MFLKIDEKIWIMILVLLGAFALAACGGAADTPPEPVEITMELSEYAFSPDSLELKVGQQVTLKVVNVGQLEHEIMFGRQVVNSEEGHPNGYQVDLFDFAGVDPVVQALAAADDEHAEGEEHDDEHAEGEEHDEGEELEEETGEGEEHADEDEHDDEAAHTHSGFMVTLQPGEEYTLTFTVTEEMLGEWEIGCFLLDGVHYQQGMVGTLTVTD